MDRGVCPPSCGQDASGPLSTRRRSGSKRRAVFFGGDNAEQHLAKPRDGSAAGGAIGGGDPGALRRRQTPLQFAAAIGQLQQPLPSVIGTAMLHDKPLPHELAQNPIEALLRDAQDAEQLADSHLRMAADKMHDPVMRAPETVLRKDGVGLGGKVAIREKQQLDALANRLVARLAADLAAVSRRRSAAIYVSHVDLFRNVRYASNGFAI